MLKIPPTSVAGGISPEHIEAIIGRLSKEGWSLLNFPGTVLVAKNDIHLYFIRRLHHDDDLSGGG